jgi:hypothetical protein
MSEDCNSYCNPGRASEEAFFNMLSLECLHIAAMTANTKGKMNSFGVKLNDELQIEQL